MSARTEAQAHPPSVQNVHTTEVNNSDYKLLRIFCWFAVLALGAADAWAARFTMYPDGVSYLDIGDAYWRGDWHNAINAYWSPFYSWILGFFVKVFKPSPYWEYPLVHLVNFLIYVAALGCFEFFLTSFVKQQKERRELKSQVEMGLPRWTWWVVGYSAFVISSLFLITISFVSGDMIVAAIIYFVAALILKIREGSASWTTFMWLGLALAIGYVAKTVMFLMSVPFLAMAVAAQANSGNSGKTETMNRAAIAVLAFVVTASPFVLLLSKAKGRPTFGDSGKINYEVNVNRVQFFIPQERSATHPVPRIAGMQEAYEYGKPITGTYPLWYDPSYWHEGIQARFDVKQQLHTLFLSALECSVISFSIFLGLGITAAIVFLYLVAPSIARCLAYASFNWPLWIPAAAGIGLYSLVVIEPRYVAAYFCPLWLVAFSGVRLPISIASGRLITGAVLSVATLTCLLTGWQAARLNNPEIVARSHVATPLCWKLAQALHARGLNPGDQLAVIADPMFLAEEAAYVARLARVRIVAQAPQEFWSADAPTRSKIDTAFASAGAKAIFTYNPPHSQADQPKDGWERLADTDYYLYRLNPAK